MKHSKTSFLGLRLLTAGLLCCVAQSGQTQNLVLNPSFGTEVTGSSGANWTSTANGTYYYYNTSAGVNTNIVSIGWTSGLGISQNTGATIQAGASYTFTVTAEPGTTPLAGVTLVFKDLTKSVTITNATILFTSQGEGPAYWQNLTMTIPSSLLTTNVGDTIGISILIDGSQWLWIAYASLTEQGGVEMSQFLYDTNGASVMRDNYTGDEGCGFTVGLEDVIVNYLGFFSTNSIDGLAIDHTVGVYTASAIAPALLGSVDVPPGASAYYTNGFYWVQLNPPLILAANTPYVVAGSVVIGDGDWWFDTFGASTNFDTYFVGANAAASECIYSAGGAPLWPLPSYSAFGSAETYGLANAAYMPMGPAGAAVAQTNVNISAGSTLTLLGCGAGQGPITNVWWKAGSPNTAMLTTTNPYAYLVITNVPIADSGTYYLTSSNALGSAQSSNVTVVISGNPVVITVSPTNVTVFNNYPVTFSMMAGGSLPISYQWYDNGAAIPGATATNYSVFVSTAMSGNVYCVASNYVNGAAHTATTSNAVLTVRYNLAYPQEFLHGFNNKLANNTYGGQQGGQFVTGNQPVRVTHLGYYAWPGATVTNGSTITCTLTNTSHYVGLYNASGSQLLGSVQIPQGANGVTNGYMWQPLDPPLVLSSNTQYLLDAQTTTSGDPWGDTYIIPDLNSYFATSCDAIYGGSGWGATPYLGGAYAGQMYSAPNMAILAPATPEAYALPESGITTNAGFDETLTAVVVGQAPLTIQWYEEPSVLLTNQTNLTLTLTNLTVAQSGSYYVIATNPVTQASAQSEDLVLTVNPDVSPYTVQDITPQYPGIVVGSSVAFSAIFNGSTTFTYGWQFNGNPVANTARISGANGNVLTISDVQTSDAGTYQLFATNAEGNGQSSPATLTVLPFLPFNNGLGFSSQGNTISWPQSNILQLTEGIGSESNSAFSCGPLYIGAFQASFTYQVLYPLGSLADGATFCIQNDSRGAAALGYGGGALGVSGASDAPGPGGVAIYPSVELEMDIYTAGGAGVFAFATNGVIGPYVTTTNENPSLVLTNGDLISNFVTYNGTTLAVTMTDVTQGSLNYGAVFSTNENINIPKVLGTSVAYVGFTGADGGTRSTQQIGDFTFVPLVPLTAQASGANLLLSWNDAIGDFMLMQSATLGSTAKWTPVAAAPTLVNGNTLQVTVSLAGTSSFYELVATNWPNF
jgi:hypothetical protein